MRILIIRLSSMGDVVLATPVFDYLASAHPDAQLHFLTDTQYAELFRDDSRLASVTAVNRDGLDSALAKAATQRWDRIVDLQNSRRTTRLLRRHFPNTPTGAFDKLHRKRLALLAMRWDRYNPALNVATRYLQAAGRLPSCRETIPPVRLELAGNGGAARSLVETSIGSVVRPLFALAPFAAWRNKQWPMEGYRTVGKYFQTKGWNVVIFGGPDDRDDAVKLRHAIGGAAVSVAGEGSLYDLACLMKCCKLCLGNDTGLTHVARACGVSTGVIYGSTTKHFGFFPYGPPAYRVFETPLLCRPCHAHGGNFCPRLTRPCLRSIGHRTVINGLEDLCRGERAREVGGEWRVA